MRYTLLARLVTGWALAAFLAGATAAAASLRAGDEVLYLDARPACCTTDPAVLADKVRLRQYIVDDSNCARWLDSDMAHWQAGSANGARTLIWVDGNNLDPVDAYRRGLQTYWMLSRCASASSQPIRFVIFSWPSEKVGGPLVDFREKARRTRPVGWQLAWLINQLPAEEPVSLLGYSYGARITGGALHVLAGGELNGGLRLDSPAQRPAMPVVLVAAATHAHWLGPNQYHGLAMQQTDQLLVVLNRQDPAMRLYPLVDKNSKAQAMGLAGPTCLSPEYTSRTRCLDVTRTTGSSHDLFRYLSCQSTIEAVWRSLTTPDASSLPVQPDSSLDTNFDAEVGVEGDFSAVPADAPLVIVAD